MRARKELSFLKASSAESSCWAQFLNERARFSEGFHDHPGLRIYAMREEAKWLLAEIICQRFPRGPLRDAWLQWLEEVYAGNVAALRPDTSGYAPQLLVQAPRRGRQ